MEVQCTCSLDELKAQVALIEGENRAIKTAHNDLVAQVKRLEDSFIALADEMRRTVAPTNVKERQRQTFAEYIKMYEQTKPYEEHLNAPKRKKKVKKS